MRQTYGKALVVEDNILNREIISSILQDIGYSVFAASDGGEGLSIIEKEDNIELIITDIFMPKKEGIGFIRAVRSKGLNVKIIAITGAVNFDTIQTNAILFGADLMIKKPFNPNEFSEKVQRLVSVRI